MRPALAALALLAVCAAGPATSQPTPAPISGVFVPAAPAPAVFAYAGEPTQGGWLRGTVPRGTVALSLDGAPVEFATDNLRFLIAFDRDAGPSAMLIATLGDGRIVTAPLTIAPRDWRIEHVAVGARPGAVPSEEYVRRRAIELERINAARRIVSGSRGWRQDFVWPAKGRISGRFGSQRIYAGQPGSYHSGIDIAPSANGGASGTPFVAPADGVVILAATSPFTLEGNLLMIDHGNGLNSAFLHSSELAVREGETVRRGQFVGRIGATGRATGPHLHWSLKWHAARLDPILFTGPME